MPKVGTIDVNLHTISKDETLYTRAGHSISHTDQVALRRTLPSNANQPMRANVRFERGFAVPGTAGAGEKSVTVSIAVTTPPGVDIALVRQYVQEACTESAVLAGTIGTTGDIHLEA